MHAFKASVAGNGGHGVVGARRKKGRKEKGGVGVRQVGRSTVRER